MPEPWGAGPGLSGRLNRRIAQEHQFRRLRNPERIEVPANPALRSEVDHVKWPPTTDYELKMRNAGWARVRGSRNKDGSQSFTWRYDPEAAGRQAKWLSIAGGLGIVTVIVLVIVAFVVPHDLSHASTCDDWFNASPHEQMAYVEHYDPSYALSSGMANARIGQISDSCGNTDGRPTLGSLGN